MSKGTQTLVNLAFTVQRETANVQGVIGILIHGYESHSIIVYGEPSAVNALHRRLTRKGYRITALAHLEKSDRRRIKGNLKGFAFIRVFPLDNAC